MATARQELLLFAGSGIVIDAIDQIVIDLAWIWLRLTGRAEDRRISPGLAQSPLRGRAAIFIPAWREAAVIGVTVTQMLRLWQQRDYVIYVGCYRNDPSTFEAASAAGSGDERLRVIVGDIDGPTTKAECLNRLYAALRTDERLSGVPYRSVVLHDAEDMVHPAGLAAIDEALADADFVQLPVRPEIQRDTRWIAAHYADEFTESHAKELVVRSEIGAAIPAAGVGCGFSRKIVTAFAASRGAVDPFEEDCLTEDYELGLLTSRLGGRSRFLRLPTMMAISSPRAAAFRMSSSWPSARRPGGSTASHSRVGTVWVGRLGSWTTGWSCGIAAGPWRP